MLHERMEAALNEQINAELYSAYLYLAMSAQFEDMNLPGFANWMRVQFQEEQVHAMKFFDYVVERGGRVRLAPIEGPQAEWDSPLSMYEAAYEHEVKVTGLINKLVDLSTELKDHATNNVLQWFVAEQVEEEASTDGIRQQLKMVGDNPHALFMIDKELAGRTLGAEE